MAKRRTARAMKLLTDAIVQTADVAPDGAAFDIVWSDIRSEHVVDGAAVQPRYCVTVFPRPIEKVGGADDGARRTPSYHLRLNVVLDLFSRIDELILCSWRPDDTPEDVPVCSGPHISILGRLCGMQIFLHFFICAPINATPCLLEDVDGQFRQVEEDV